MKIKTLCLMALVLALSAACGDMEEKDYVKLVASGELHFEKVPPEKLNSQFISQVIEEQPYRFLDLPRERQTDWELERAVVAFCPGLNEDQGCSDEEQDSLDYFLARVLDERSDLLWGLSAYDAILHHYPGMLVRFPDEMWSEEDFRRAMELTPYWGLLVTQSAKCDFVHAVPLEVWRDAALQYTDLFVMAAPNHIQAEVFGNPELLEPLVEKWGFRMWGDLIAPDTITPDLCRANYRYLQAHELTDLPRQAEREEYMLPGRCLSQIGEFPEVRDKMLVGA